MSTIWPRRILACTAPSCRYVEAEPDPADPDYADLFIGCGECGSQLVTVLVNPVRRDQEAA